MYVNENHSFDKYDGSRLVEAGHGATADFVSGLMRSVPPLNDLFNTSGLDLPNYLAEKQDKTEKPNGSAIRESS